MPDRFFSHLGRLGVKLLSFAQERIWFLDRLQPGCRAPPVSQPRCQTAKSAYCNGRSGRGEGRPSENAA